MSSIRTTVAAGVIAAMTLAAGTALAAGGSSGPNVKYAKQGQIGEIITNPYKIAPLTAINRSGGYKLENVKVHIVPKTGGSDMPTPSTRAKCSRTAAFPSSVFTPTT